MYTFDYFIFVKRKCQVFAKIFKKIRKICCILTSFCKKGISSCLCLGLVVGGRGIQRVPSVDVEDMKVGLFHGQAAGPPKP